MLRILNVEPDGYSPEARAILAHHADVDERALDRAELLSEIGRYDALIVRLRHQVDREIMAASPRLRAIASATTGLDHIDVEEARRRDIGVITLKGETEFLRSVPATAELTWGLILSLTRRIPAATEAVRRGEWDRSAFIGRDLAGLTIGLVGLGRIGERVACYATAFDMKVAAYDPFKTNWPAGIRRLDSLRELAAVSDVLSVHVPLEPATTKFIDRSTFDAMRSGSYFVNTSRGLIINELDLIEALATSKLAGAALDVFAEERTGPFADSVLATACRTTPNLIMTPHIGGASFDSMRATEVFIARKLAALLAGTGGKLST
jgi:D-3-phosphoglycerate dehydrogenase